MKAGVVSELELYYGAKMLGASAQQWSQLPLCETISEASELKLIEVVKLGDDVCARYALKQD